MTPHTFTLAAALRPTPPDALTSAELLALQLLARGYAPAQIAALRGAALVDVLWDLQRVLTALRAPTVREAVAEARRRGLID